MHTPSNDSSVKPLWHYNASLLEQALAMIGRLQREAKTGFVYSQAVGPHVRHVIEHYQALLNALSSDDACVDYDARNRDLRIQTDPTKTVSALMQLIEQFVAAAGNEDLNLDTRLSTRLKAGSQGELEVSVTTTLGRELLFLASHSVHHYALLGQYCRAAGLELGHEFGKAPATIAFEMAHAAISA
jgi:uncharacterized damage-inducible protein DinB